MSREQESSRGTIRSGRPEQPTGGQGQTPDSAAIHSQPSKRHRGREEEFPSPKVHVLPKKVSNPGRDQNRYNGKMYKKASFGESRILTEPSSALVLVLY